MMEKEEIFKTLLSIARMAYNEGREHQKDYDLPEVGMYFEKNFEDSKIYKTIIESYSKGVPDG